MSEQRDRLRGLLESEAAGYWDLNIPEQTEYMSPRFKAMFGYADNELANTPEARQGIMHPDDLPGMLELFKAHIQSKGAVAYDKEVRYWHKNGSIVWVLCRGRVVEWAPDGQAIRMMGVHIDITALKEREQQVQKRANEIRRFAFIAAHDLVQPLNTIDNSIKILMEGMPDTDDSDLMAIKRFLGEATGRMKKRINGILDYAKLQDDAAELERIDLNALLADVILDLKTLIDSADVNFEIDQLPTVLGIRTLIAQVLQNLINNSIKYRDRDRHCHIKIKAKPHAESHKALILVSDNGIGIPSEYREKVFELFTRLHSDNEYTGTGLGLALSARIIQLHGGTIQVVDSEDSGTTIAFELQLAED